MNLSVHKRQYMSAVQLHSVVYCLVTCTFLFGLFFQKTGEKRIVIKCQKFAFEVNQDFFYLKLLQTIDDIYQHPTRYNLDSNYVHILSICLKSKFAFQHFYERTAAIMVQHGYPENVQKYWDQLMFDIRIQLPSNEHFCEMYSKDLYHYVKLMSYSCSGTMPTDVKLNALINNLLLNLKCKDYLKFVILTTHFKEFSNMLTH